MARKKEFDEDELLEKAVHLFWRKGYNGTSAQDLVDGLGINRSSIYNTYTDKLTLFKMALQRYQQTETNAMVTMLARADNAKKAVKQIFSGLIKESAEDALLKGCFMVNTSMELSGTDQDVGEIVKKNNQSVEDALTRIIEKGQKDGQFSAKQNARTYARFIFGNITAIRVAARSGTPKQVLQDMADVAMSAIKS